MYFFNLKALEDDLINLKVSEDEAFNYFFILSLLTASLTYLNISSGNFDFISNLIEGLIQIVISFFAIKKTYSINKLGDGEYYYKRFFSLSFVVMFKTILYAFLLIIPYLLCILFNITENIYIMSFLGLSASIFINVIYYYLLCKSFKRIANERLVKIQIESVK